MTLKSPEAKERARQRNKEYYLEHREQILQRFKEYHQATYDQRREKKNAQTRERRQATNWYQENVEEQRANTRKYYAAHKEEQQAKARARSAELRLQALQKYGGKCVCCGEAEPKFLSIDHIHNDGGAHRRVNGKSGSMIYRWLKNHNYPPGFQVLCHNCNEAKGRYGICPHQRDIR